MSSSNCCFLTCIQISQEVGQVVWYSHLFQNFPQFIVIHTVKGFSIVNKAEVDIFLELSCFVLFFFFDDPADIGNLISGSSAFSKFSFNIWKLMVHVLLNPGLENFEHYFASVWDECNCVVVWTPSGYSISAPWCRRVATANGQLSGGRWVDLIKLGPKGKLHVTMCQGCLLVLCLGSQIKQQSYRYPLSLSYLPSWRKSEFCDMFLGEQSNYVFLKPDQYSLVGRTSFWAEKDQFA